MIDHDQSALFTMPPVHPVAALFPMLPDDELEDLARDIKENGLVHPIVLDSEGTLIDGRNRLTACRLAGVEPEYTTLNGHDPVAYILSSNVNRRHLSKGQRAMAVALACPLNGQTTRSSADLIGVSNTNVGNARIVQKYTPELADAVMVGTRSLNDAYAEAKQRKSDLEDRKDEADKATKQLAELRRAAPDLADLVAEERLSLAEALHTWQKRQREDQERRERQTSGFAHSISTVWSLVKDEPGRVAEEWIPEANSLAKVAELRSLWTADGLRSLSRSIEQMADVIEKRGGAL